MKGSKVELFSNLAICYDVFVAFAWATLSAIKARPSMSA